MLYGARKLTRELRLDGHAVGRPHVTTLTRRMGTILHKPRMTVPAREAPIRHHLLSRPVIDRLSRVWAADLTYVPIAHVSQYFTAPSLLASGRH